MKRISLGILLSLSTPTFATTINFYNACPFPIEVGQMGPGNFAHLESWQANSRYIGADNVPLLGLAYYGYKSDAFPGYGNMTLAEFSFNTSWYNLDSYDVSLVDAFNLPIDIRPNGDGGGNAARCAADLNPGCPDSQRIWQNGWTVACSKFGDRDTPYNPAAQYFANACSGAYSWSKDDSKVKSVDGIDYTVTFCP